MWVQTKEKSPLHQAGTIAKGNAKKSYSTNTIIPKHSVLIHPKQYKKQPQGAEMGKITNYLKKSYNHYTAVTDILNCFGNGQNMILSDVQVDEDNRFQFISSSIFAIDVDDINKVTDPKEIISKFNRKAVGIFYTFSHGKQGKGNRYRILFQLDQVITDELKMKSIIELVANDLKELGLPVDVQAKNPLQVVRGGIASILINPTNKLETNNLLERVKRKNQWRQQELYNEFEKELRPVPFDKLKEMAEKIGHIPTGTGQGELWKRLVVGIKHYANTGYISQDEGYELFDIISGNEQTQRSWEMLRANGQATIKTLIYEAKQRGYKNKYTYYANEHVKENFKRESIKVKGHIPTDLAETIITSEKRILIDSPTGSGKTTAFLNAFKNLSVKNKNHFYIFAMPTIALTLQNSLKHQISAIKGQTNFKTIFKSIKEGQRVFISTYDMVPSLIDFIRKIEKTINFTLVVDELHKFVTDYDTNYRHEAISNLYAVGKEASNFIGLSGTIDDIYKDEFDKVIKIDNGQPSSPCQEYVVYTYQKRQDALSELAQLVETWSTQRKLLIYIQSKEKIKQLQYVLRRKGIKVRTISANTKSNQTYKQIIESETIDDDVQVVLTTSVIADGVNIENDVNWEVIAVCNDFSNLFNYSSIKQISNRLRNTYRRFSLFIQEPKDDSQEPFNIESAYRWRMKIAENIVNEINEHPYFDSKLFRKSVIERRYGIHKHFDKLAIDSLFLRHSVSKEQENYFYRFRYAFIHAVEKVLHKPLAGILNVTEEIENNNLDMTATKDIIEFLEEQSKQTEDEKSKNILNTFTKEVFEAFKNDDEKVIESFRQAVVPRHFSCIERLITFADYESCKKIVVSVKRDADTHSFFTDIRNLIDVSYFKSINRPSKTKKIVTNLLKLNKFMTNEEYKTAIAKIAKQTRVSMKDVKSVENMIVFEHSRKGKERTRVKRIVGTISLDSIVDKHDIDTLELAKVITDYASKQSKTTQVVVNNALESYLQPTEQTQLNT